MFTEAIFKEEEEYDKQFVKGKEDKANSMKAQSSDYYYLLGYNDEKTKNKIKALIAFNKAFKDI